MKYSELHKLLRKIGCYELHQQRGGNPLWYSPITETIADFHAAYEEMKAYYREAGEAFEEVEFDFSYDVPSFLNYYKGLLTLAGLGRITGINERQLSQYVSGYRNPSAKTTKKIEDALHNFGSELQQVRFV